MWPCVSGRLRPMVSKTPVKQTLWPARQFSVASMERAPPPCFQTSSASLRNADARAKAPLPATTASASESVPAAARRARTSTSGACVRCSSL